MATQTKDPKADGSPQNPQQTQGGVTIKGSSDDAGKKGGERRLFQTSPETKEYLTKDEAENPPIDPETKKPIRPRFFWAEEPVQVEPDGKRRTN